MTTTKPIDTKNEDAPIDTLCYLTAKGFTEEEPVLDRARLKSQINDFMAKIEEGEEDVRAGKVRPATELIAKMKEKYGI